MKRKLTSKHCALMLLALFATAWSTQAWAGIKIHVKVVGNTNATPYLYMWKTETDKVSANWPGDAMSETMTTADGVTWYVADVDDSDFKLIINNNGDNQSREYSGIKADKYYAYNSNNGESYNLTHQYDIPSEAHYKDGKLFVYFVNTSEWTDPKAHVYNSSEDIAGTWPGGTMTKVDNTDNLYLWEKESSSTPSNVIFNNNGDNTTQTSAFTYVNGGYYSSAGLITTITKLTLNSTNFPDANFRAALAEQLGINEGDDIEPNNVRVLDVSGKGISNLAGIEHFTNLEELNISNNNISYGDITALTKLKKIIASGNSGLKGFGVNAANANNPILRITSSSVLEYVDVSNTAAYYLTALNNNCASTLKTLIAANNPTFDNGTFTNCSALEYLDFSNCGLTSNALSSTYIDCPNLEYLDCSGNRNLVTSGVYITNKTKLKYFDMSGCDATPANTVANLANAKNTLEYLDLSNNNMTATGVDPALSGFTALKTFKFNTQANWTKGLTITNCPALEMVDVIGNAKMTNLAIDNCPSINTVLITNDTSLPSLSITNSNLTAIPSITDPSTATILTKIDLTGNLFTAVPEVGGNVTTLVMNNNQLTDINAPSNIQYLYAQNNNFGGGEYTLPATSLVGLDLGNNGFTKFTAVAENATTDEWAIDYSVTPPVTVLANSRENDGSNTTLQALHLGGNTALESVTVNGYKGLTKLASDNDMTTVKGNGLYIKGNTALKTLDVSNNRLEILGQDNSLQGLSGLEELNVSHNKLLTLTNRSAISNNSNPRSAYGNGTYTAATCPNIEDLTGLKKLNISYNLLSDSIHLAKNTALEWLDASHNRTITERAEGLTQYYRKTTDGTFAAWYETTWKTEKDKYTEDLNDTIGLRMLDLYYQTNLKYLDISYTNIENTAMYRIHVNNRVGPENLTTSTMASNGKDKVGRWGVPRFVLLNHCPALVEFHSNYNAMKSLGIGSAPTDYSTSTGGVVTGCPNLEVLEAIECRGQDPAIMEGEITISVRNPKMRYYNVKNSDFDKVNPYTTNENGTSGQYLETLIVDGNYTKDNANGWNLTDAGTLDVSNNPMLVNLQANKCPNLITVKANGLDYLHIVSLTQDTTVTTVNDESVTTKLANIYVDHDKILDEVLGLETLSALSVYHANDSHFTGPFVMPVLAKSTLTDLRVGNEALSYASTRNNLTAVDMTGYTAVQHLETQNNPQVEALDLSGFTNTLEHINFANNHIDNAGIGITEGGYLPSLPALQYFNCSNDSKWTTEAGNRLTDLILTNSTGVKEIYGNNNDLHYITGSFDHLTNIEFAHNHINGIDLSAAPNAAVNSEDNGRTIVADCSKFTPQGDFGNVVTVYFFQLEDVDNGTLLTQKTSSDSNYKTRYLGEDGMVINNIAAWTEDAAVFGGSSKNVTVDPGNMSQYLNADDIQGTIVVLKPTNETSNGADGQAKYNYTTRTGDVSEFYLNWSSDGTITGINSVTGDSDYDLAGTYGGIVVAGKDGTVVGVYDLNGRQVASETISGGKVVIDGLAPGIYLVNGTKVLVK